MRSRRAGAGKIVALKWQGTVEAFVAGEALVTEIRAVNPRWVSKIDTIEGLLAESVAVPRSYLVLVGALAALALTLAVVGTYGVVDYTVTQRTHEFGVRMALVATRGDVLFMLVRQTSVVVVAGRVLAWRALGPRFVPWRACYFRCIPKTRHRSHSPPCSSLRSLWSLASFPRALP